MLRRLLDSPWPYFGLAAALAVVALGLMVEFNPPQRPVGTARTLETLRDRDDLNIVFILIDTLRADRLGTYGYERDTSPIIDTLTSEGIRFDHVEAQSSWTKASMASLWTASYPYRAGVRQYPDALSHDFLLPAEIFRDNGWVTGGIYRNGWVDANFGFDQGFDIYLKPRASATPERVKRRNPSAHPLMGTDLDVTESAIEFMRSNRNDNFLLYLHYMDVHQYLYDDDSALFGTSLSDAYDNAIRWTDRNVSAVVGMLQELELLDRTIVVIASDHGESFYEHGEEGHARTLYREVTETPLLIFPPFRIEGGLVVEHQVQNVDIWPTLLELVGLPPMEDVDGRSLVPHMLEAGGVPVDPASTAPRPTYAELDRHWGRGEGTRVVSATVDGGYRLIHWGHGNTASELYDHSLDPKEQRNVAEREPEVVERMVEHAERNLAAGPQWEAEPVELDEMRKGQLRALGYMIDGK